MNCANFSSGGAWDRSTIPASGCATNTPASTPNESSPYPTSGSPIPKSCQCGEVLKGVIKPWQCKVFGSACTPETPLGALMVSSEGACAAYYQYGGVKHHEAAE